MQWIQVDAGLPQHPKLKRLARALGERDTARLVGGLILLWAAVRQYAPDGNLSGWSDDEIATYMGRPSKDGPRTVQGLSEAGFIECDGEGNRLIHDWMAMSGKYLRDAERKRNERSVRGQSTDSPRPVHGQSEPRARVRTGQGSTGQTGQEPRSTVTPTPREKRAASPFTRPTIAEVLAYCTEREAAGKSPVNPEAWLDHYTANGWRVGRSPMRDWKAAVRQWERNGFHNGTGVPTDPPATDQPEPWAVARLRMLKDQS